MILCQKRHRPEKRLSRKFSKAPTPERSPPQSCSPSEREESNIAPFDNQVGASAEHPLVVPKAPLGMIFSPQRHECEGPQRFWKQKSSHCFARPMRNSGSFGKKRTYEQKYSLLFDKKYHGVLFSFLLFLCFMLCLFTFVLLQALLPFSYGNWGGYGGYGYGLGGFGGYGYGAPFLGGYGGWGHHGWGHHVGGGRAPKRDRRRQP